MGGCAMELRLHAAVAALLFVLHISSTAAVNATLNVTAAATFCPDGGTHVGYVQQLRLSSPTSGATIYYTLDGTTPTTASTVFSAPLNSITSTKNVSVLVTAPGHAPSPVTWRVFNVTPGTLSTKVAAPVFSQNGGNMKMFDKITIKSAADTDLYWTAGVNYTTPTVCNWKSAVKGLVVVNFSSKTTSKVVISAFAAKNGMLHSEIRHAEFTVKEADEDFSIGLGASRVKFQE